MQWHGRLNFVPLRIRVHGQNDMNDTPDHAPADRPTQSKRVIASPVKRSAMD
ncbi:BZ3500_MvSof-1268-A1-R1_Chr9g10751 [Microbotryum saponariae]|uniref:BZ3500_MvSof-1268-A1-R1_Chr9g10751 protein n=1 Tax=Microbotryum saponariae TaxID=289078 RepID=A0A2X0N741_9BASI|nr:BZ3501_MvSof-1269-A2-R1_Chr9g10499 [Microbotryum saponariae]SDA00627.1 BZ3500_MvSof-1268-A1-R1_Chr9g10751 [Microbotryum saponariae]